MNKIIIFGVMTISVLLLSGCVYSPDDSKILSHFNVDEDYKVVSISSSFVSGNECFWFVNITIQNISTGKYVYLNDFNYDDCEDKLYYGWYKRNKLNERYGIIL